MQKGDLALIVRDCGWQDSFSHKMNGVGNIVEIEEFDANMNGYRTWFLTIKFEGMWWCKEEELCKIPEELRNEPIEVIKLYCNL